jgi:hypothetical protein
MKFRAVIFISITLFISACASTGLFGPKEMSYSSSRLQTHLAKRFPHDWSGMGLMNVRLTAPQVVIPARADRLQISFDVAAGMGNQAPQPMGRLDIESGLRFDASKQAVFLDRPRLLNANLRGAGRLLGGDNAVWADPLLNELAQRMPIYRAEDSYSDGFGRDWRLDDARIENGKLRVRMQRAN